MSIELPNFKKKVKIHIKARVVDKVTRKECPDYEVKFENSTTVVNNIEAMKTLKIPLKFKIVKKPESPQEETGKNNIFKLIFRLLSN